MSELAHLIPPLKAIVIEAGAAILDVYHADTPIEVENKSDDSPVTKADHAAHIIIDKGLKALDTLYPVLSEEGGMTAFEARSAWQRYWLVDPLDGTKEFINKNDEFTVNIALIDGAEAILGLVYVPVTGALYYGAKDLGAWKELNGEKKQIQASPLNLGQDLTVVGSRRHGTEALDTLLKTIESRFDNVLYRAGFASTRPFGRQLSSHGHFVVNGKKLDVPSYLVKKGDVIILASVGAGMNCNAVVYRY